MRDTVAEEGVEIANQLRNRGKRDEDIGTPSGRRAPVGRSFRKNLAGAFEEDDGTARAVTRAARPISAANIPLPWAVSRV